MNNPFRCMIVDDEPLAIDIIENYLNRMDNVETIRCENAVEAFGILKDQAIDLLFLDIEMPMLTGLDFLASIKNAPPVIITTAYRDYAVESFEWEVIDYLVKPISFPRFLKAFERAAKLSGNKITRSDSVSDNNSLFLKVDRKLVKVMVDEILYIESLKDYIRVTTRSGSMISYHTLTAITEKLPEEKFMRIHRSFTVAIDKINAMDGNSVEIAGKPIPVSRELRAELVKKLQH